MAETKFRVGQRVRFTGYKDDIFPEPREQILMRGGYGTVVEHVLDCGATPDDPMHRVWVKGKGSDAYWFEELEAA